jgi:hypothetical protein
MSQPDEATITVRIPGALKQAVEALVASRGMTLSGFVRRALEECLVPPQRVSELPGLSKNLDDFLNSEEVRSQRGRAMLLTVDEGGHRAVYPGYIDYNLLNSSMVGIRTRGPRNDERPWVLLRKNIVGWYSESEDLSTSPLLQYLAEAGWHPVRFPPR